MILYIIGAVINLMVFYPMWKEMSERDISKNLAAFMTVTACMTSFVLWIVVGLVIAMDRHGRDKQQ